MSISALNYIANMLEALSVNYEFGGWASDPVPNPYFVGEYTETESFTKEENGYQESTLLLTGTGTSWYALEQVKEKIENNLPKTAILSNGNGVAVFYLNSLIVPTGDAELKRIQINLQIKEWSVN